ncbi:zinc-binding dehydrogenase [Streptomyces sp. NPDC006602]|uniref:zinc-binding dehydrogenase n=1 Tax=Streptomyces sp. NPDC006602 TaxID=3364751 RepID=UPI0036967CB1
MRGLNMPTYPVHETTRDPERLRRAQAFVASGLRAGAFVPVVDRVFGLDEIAAAHHYLEEGTQADEIMVTVDH